DDGPNCWWLSDTPTPRTPRDGVDTDIKIGTMALCWTSIGKPLGMSDNKQLDQAQGHHVSAPQTPTQSLPSDQPRRHVLKDLELPPALTKDAEEICRRQGSGTAADRQRVEQEIKLQYFFGGQDVAYLETDDGLIIVATGDMNSATFNKALGAL